MITRPILFSGAMVRALLDGSKTQTRRIVKDLPPWPIMEICHDSGGTGKWMPNGPAPNGTGMAAGHWRLCPYGQPGDRLWVRETWRGVVEISPPGQPVEHGVARYVPDREHCRRVEYAATQAPDREPWRPSIHMPRWASRILLEIVAVRVERLQDITEGDAWAEGVDKAEVVSMPCADGATAAYSALWQRINGAGSWEANPWVWVVEFKRVMT